MAVRAPPTCRKPVGDGAKRTRTGPWIWVLMMSGVLSEAASPRGERTEGGTVSRGRRGPQWAPPPHRTGHPRLLGPYNRVLIIRMPLKEADHGTPDFFPFAGAGDP